MTAANQHTSSSAALSVLNALDVHSQQIERVQQVQQAQQTRQVEQVRSRLAPTPSGYLHIGNAASFVLTWAITRKAHGSLHLRIDDIDADRKRPEYVRDVFDVLAWLGLDYDTGPRSVDEFERDWSQHHTMRQHAYASAIEYLSGLDDESALFACTCTRSHLQMRIRTLSRMPIRE
jgi:glutamyl/glutaminyl-tRNA synthetase